MASTSPDHPPPILAPSHSFVYPFTLPIRDLIHQHRVTLSASTAAIVGGFVGYPFDFVKTRMQTFAYPNLSHCVKHTYATEGFTGFFRGMLPQLSMSAVFKSTSFAAYVHAKQAVTVSTVSHPWTPHTVRSSQSVQLFLASFLGGGCSGMLTAVLTQPLELIKVLRQLQSLMNQPHLASQSSSGPLINPLPSTISTIMTTTTPTPSSIPPPRLHPPQLPTLPTPFINELTTYGIARELIRVHGPTGLFFGFGSHLLRESLGGAVYFSSYEMSKYILSRLSGSHDEPSMLVHVAAGGLCGLFAWMVIFPTDCIKSTIQRDALSPERPRYPNVWSCAQALYAQGGLRSFYRGISATMIRAAPLHALNWVVYERMLQLCTTSIPVSHRH